MDLRDGLLAAYDDQLRIETASATSVTELGPLRLATYEGGRGNVAYRDLGDADEQGVRELVAATLAHYRADPHIARVEWKTRGHDRAPGLHDALLAHGFEEGERESVMIGEARALAVDVPLPEGVALRQIWSEADVRAMCRQQQAVFGDDLDPEELAQALLRRLALRDDTELWVAEADGEVVCAGRLEPVSGTEFAGIWGGATLERWRGRGLYRALTAARARSALRGGKRWIQSDSTEGSRPILERSGFLAVTTTTPYEWSRAAADGD